MLITPHYAEPARDVALDVAEDGSDWYFPYSQGRDILVGKLQCRQKKQVPTLTKWAPSLEVAPHRAFKRLTILISMRNCTLRIARHNF